MCFPLARRTRSTWGDKSSSTPINMRSRQRMPVTQPASTNMAQQGQAQMAGQSLMPTLETAGQQNIEIQQFGGFGPMGVNALGDW